MQKRIAINGWNEVQPTTFEYAFETTSSEGSGRMISGTAAIAPLFTVEAFEVEYNDLTISQASTLLQHIVQKPSAPYFNLYYFSPYYGAWRTAQFYVGDGSLRVSSLKESEERIESITCRFVGRAKLC